MSPKGKTPTLISGSSGACNYVVAKKLRPCKRCHGNITKGTKCVEVNNAGQMGRKTYCLECFAGILDKTQSDLNKLRDEIE